MPIEQFAAMFGVTSKTVRLWRRKGLLRVLKTAEGGSGRVLVERADVRRFIERQRQESPFGETRR